MEDEIFSCCSMSLARMDPGWAPAPQAPPMTFAEAAAVSSLDSSVSCSGLFWSVVSVGFSGFCVFCGPIKPIAFDSSSFFFSFSAVDVTATATLGFCLLGVFAKTGTIVGSGKRRCRFASVNSCRTANCRSAYSNQSSSNNP